MSFEEVKILHLKPLFLGNESIFSPDLSTGQENKNNATLVLFGWPYHPPPSLMVPFSLTPASSLWSQRDSKVWMVKQMEDETEGGVRMLSSRASKRAPTSVVISKFPVFSNFSMEEYLPLLKSGFFGRGWKNPVFQRLESWNQEKNWILKIPVFFLGK